MVLFSLHLASYLNIPNLLEVKVLILKAFAVYNKL